MNKGKEGTFMLCRNTYVAVSILQITRKTMHAGTNSPVNCAAGDLHPLIANGLLLGSDAPVAGRLQVQVGGGSADVQIAVGYVAGEEAEWFKTNQRDPSCDNSSITLAWPPLAFSWKASTAWPKG